MKASSKIKTATTVPAKNLAPGVFVYDSKGNAAGILNLHTNSKNSWGGMDGHHFSKYEAKLELQHLEKGVIVFRIKNNGCRVDMAWVNGNAEGKSAFTSKLGVEPLFFNRALSEAEGLED